MFHLRMDVSRRRITIILASMTAVKQHLLHLVHSMQNSGVIFLHELRNFRITEIEVNAQAVENFKPRLDDMTLPALARDF